MAQLLIYVYTPAQPKSVFLHGSILYVIPLPPIWLVIWSHDIWPMQPNFMTQSLAIPKAQVPGPVQYLKGPLNY